MEGDRDLKAGISLGQGSIIIAGSLWLLCDRCVLGVNYAGYLVPTASESPCFFPPARNDIPEDVSEAGFSENRLEPVTANSHVISAYFDTPCRPVTGFHFQV